ncbi:MAG: transcriptional repressor [Candidatus Pacebacteria bacterium]|nr:transcriptional repressor [Candidatus Paceibacterota bacterium]MBP9866899.1 transcriptional repressor [Candidatus Paceibacterota bacterium]
MATYSKEDLILMLHEAELRVTDHRLSVLMYLSKVKQPVTVFEIIDALRKKDNIDQATVYRNLLSLHESGLIRRLDFNHGHAHYELETGRVSYTLVCSKCETIEKIEGVSVEDTLKKILKRSKKFKNTIVQSFEIYGACKSCS